MGFLSDGHLLTSVHVGIIIYGHIHRQSGGYLYDRKIVTHLREQGHRVTVFPQPDRAYLRHGLDNFNLPYWRKLAETSLDVLLQDELNHASLVVGNRWLRSQVTYPIVSIVHHLRSSENHPQRWNRIYRWVEKQYLKTVDAFVFNSPSTRRAVAELVTPDPSLIARPSGRRFGAPISPIRIEARAHQPGPLRILFVGNVIPRKNVHALLRGCAHLDSVEWRLDIVGNATADEAYTMAVQRTIQKQDLTDIVELHGSVDDSELHTLLQHAHVLAVPSTYEGYGIVYVEGMGQGLPALATPNGGPVDVIDDGVTGFLLDDPVEDGIADRLRMLASNRGRLAHMGRAAREAYVASPTWTDTGRAVTTFLRRLTRDRL